MNNPQLALMCCDYYEVNYYRGILPDTVQVSEYCNFTPGGYYNAITGTVTYNCPGGTPVNGNVRIVVNNQYNASFAENGSYTAFTSYGVQNVTPQFPEPGYFTITPANYTFNFANTGNDQTANFCVSPNGVHPDLEVTILPMTTVRPGFDAKYKLIIKNKGTETQSGSVSFSFDDTILDYVSSIPVVSTQSNSLLSWNFSGLAPFQDREISLTLNVNSPLETPAVNLGDVLHNSVQLTTVQTDETPADNYAELNQTVIGSFDPNDKTVLEGSQVSIARVGDYLNYVVRFQNTGTAAAENVVVSDFLDGYDYNTLQILSASHPFECRMRTDYALRLEFIFEGINLPASTADEAGSYGYVAFRIKPSAATVVGNVIENTANIYFDYNYPIVTNTVATTFTELAVPSFRHQQFVLYPNPTSGLLHIETLDNQPIIKTLINNVLGQTVLVFGNKTMLDVGSLVKGTYFVTIETEYGKATQRFIKL
ncbi:MAG: T9SS type A sorting domain-containing protein [Flavobacterium sp.]